MTNDNFSNEITADDDKSPYLLASEADYANEADNVYSVPTKHEPVAKDTVLYQVSH